MSPVTFRPATIDDVALAADLMTAAYPPEPEDPIALAYDWNHPQKDRPVARYMVELGGRPVGLATWSHADWQLDPDRYCFVWVAMDREVRTKTSLADALKQLEAEALRESPRMLRTFCNADQPDVMEVLTEAGFKQDRTSRVFELDLAKHGPRLVDEARRARQKTEAAGIALMTLDADPDPDKVRKLYELSEASRQDIPRSTPRVPHSFESFMDGLAAPWTRLDRYWIARDADRLVAESHLVFPPVRGTVWTGYTGSDRAYRGRGIASATKLQTLAQAFELGVPYVRTDNDAENAAMVHINERLGYTGLPRSMSLVKRVKST